jgi:hypothetical protein
MSRSTATLGWVLGWLTCFAMLGTALAQDAGTVAGPTRGTVGYAGRLTGLSGNVDFEFTFKDAATPTNTLCVALANNVALAPDGAFNTEIDITPCGQAQLFNGRDVIYDVAFRSAGGGSFTVAATGLKVSPVPYAKYADYASTLAVHPGTGAAEITSPVDIDGVLQLVDSGGGVRFSATRTGDTFASGNATVTGTLTAGTVAIGLTYPKCTAGSNCGTCTFNGTAGVPCIPCPSGQKATGGGCAYNDNTAVGNLVSAPADNGAGWICNGGGSPLVMYAVCANVQ